LTATRDKLVKVSRTEIETQLADPSAIVRANPHKEAQKRLKAAESQYMAALKQAQRFMASLSPEATASATGPPASRQLDPPPRISSNGNIEDLEERFEMEGSFDGPGGGATKKRGREDADPKAKKKSRSVAKTSGSTKPKTPRIVDDFDLGVADFDEGFETEQTNAEPVTATVMVTAETSRVDEREGSHEDDGGEDGGFGSHQQPPNKKRKAAEVVDRAFSAIRESELNTVAISNDVNSSSLLPAASSSSAMMESATNVARFDPAAFDALRLGPEHRQSFEQVLEIAWNRVGEDVVAAIQERDKLGAEMERFQGMLSTLAQEIMALKSMFEVAIQ
jgi:hypothetical protein